MPSATARVDRALPRRLVRAAVQRSSRIVDDVAERFSGGVAEDLHERIMDAVRGLETLPRRCVVVPELHAEGIDSYRELLIGPYRIMFGLRGSDAVVLTAVDGRRDLAELLIERALRQP